MSYKIKPNAPSGGGFDETELLSRKDHFLLFVERNRKAVLGGLFVVILAGIGGGGVFWFEHQQTKEAWVLEGQAQALYLDRSMDDPEKSKESVSQAAELYRQILDKYPRTTPAQSALYLLGNSQMEQEDFKGAVQSYQKFLDQYGRNAMLQGLVRQRLAYAYLLDGDRENALQEFSTILSSPNVYNKDQVLFELAKLEESEGTIDKAVDRYKELLEQFPLSPFSSEASLRVKALSPEEETPDPAGSERQPSENKEAADVNEEKKNEEEKK